MIFRDVARTLPSLLVGLTTASTITNSTGAVPTYTWRYNASSIISPNVNISANGTGTPYAFACQSASQAWSSSSSSAFEAASSTWPVIPAFTSTWTLTSSLWKIWTTDCDNITHVRGTTPTATSVYASTTVWVNYTITPSYTLPPQPSCSIQPGDCKAVLESWSTETSALSSWESSLTVPYYVANRPSMPMCTSVCSAAPECQIMADHVELVYWPVVTTGANSCGTNGTTVTDAYNGPSTIVTLGTTFTSPTPYLSFRSISAWDWGCNTQIGTGISGTIIPVQPGHLSSARGWHLGRSAYSFNLADLNGFITSAAFFQMQAYDWSGPGNTIYDDLYFPTVWLPDMVTQLKPEWTTCGLSPFGVNDPPIALTTVKYLEPTSTKGPIQVPGYEIDQSAKPGSAPTSVVQATALPYVTDPLASSTPTGTKPTEQNNGIAATDSAQASANLMGSLIAAALGLSESPASSPSSQTGAPTPIAIGKDGISVVGRPGIIAGSDIYAPAAAQSAGTVTVTAYAVAYTTISGYKAVVGSDVTIAVGGPATVIDGNTVSAAEDGLVLGAVTVPYLDSASTALMQSTTGPSASSTFDTEAPSGIENESSRASSTSAPGAEVTASGANDGVHGYGGMFALVAALTAVVLIT